MPVDTYGVTCDSRSASGCWWEYEIIGIERLGAPGRATVRVEPLRTGSVVVELDSVPVGVGEIHRDTGAVVGAVADRMAAFEQASHRLAELAATGIEERHVMESRVQWPRGDAPALCRPVRPM